jgi:hypothetical protein
MAKDGSPSLQSEESPILGGEEIFPWQLCKRHKERVGEVQLQLETKTTVAGCRRLRQATHPTVANWPSKEGLEKPVAELLE